MRCTHQFVKKIERGMLKSRQAFCKDFLQRMMQMMNFQEIQLSKQKLGSLTLFCHNHATV